MLVLVLLRVREGMGAFMMCDPLTYRQGQDILLKLDQILALINVLTKPPIHEEKIVLVGNTVMAECPSVKTPLTGIGFDLFWQEFPRKIGKGAAELAWKKLKPDATLQARIIQAVKAQCKSEQWRRDEGRFIPHPATWLNAKRWEDEIEVKIANDKPPVFYRTLPDRPEGEACPPEAKAILSKLLGKDFSL